MTDGQEKYIIDGLELIGRLQPGTTISTSTKKIVNHETWSGAFSRLWNRDDRHKTVEFIESVIQALGDEVEKKPYSINIYRLKIHRALSGLEHLEKTYKDDKAMLVKIKSIIDVLNNLIYPKVKTPIVFREDYTMESVPVEIPGRDTTP